MAATLPFQQIWAVDFEFSQAPGERPQPVCCVGRELRTGKLVRLWLADGAPAAPPYDTDPDALFVAYFASAELSCHLALDWSMPARIVDLYAEFRRLTSGLSVPCGNGLLGALADFGLEGVGAVEKESMRQLAIRGAPFTEQEEQALLDYCEADVSALTRLLPAMMPNLDLPRALLRGRYMAAVARMEKTGVSIDTGTLTVLRENWTRIKNRLIAEIDTGYGVYVPVGRQLDPTSKFGAVILEEAENWNVDPHTLAEAVDDVWAEERHSTAETTAAIQAARHRTGLTSRQVLLWEDGGKDHTTYPRLDVDARELAGEYPALGIGQGYVTDDGPDDTDYAGRLWDRLRQPTLARRPRYDPGLVREAAERVAAAGLVGMQYPGWRQFSTTRWAAYLERAGIPWPRLDSGELALDDDTFREMAKLFPKEIGPIRELRHALSQMKLNELSVGRDGRNRCLLSPFSSSTGRNQPSNTKYIFGPSVWLRSLIKPGPGRAVAYCDWSQQELAIAARLSGDAKMQEAYISGDFYLTFGKMAGVIPPDGTKATHAVERDRFKVVSLGVLYGMSAEGLGRRLDLPVCWGRELLELHQQTFRTFWAWSQAVQDFAMLYGYLETVFGWRVHVGPNVNPRSLRNFPMQGNGSEMMRLACCLATERGIQVCAPVHDALLVEGPIASIEDVVADTEAAMREASEFVLPGFPLRSEAKIVRYPERYSDRRGLQMWDTVSRLLAKEMRGPPEPTCPTMGQVGCPIVGHVPVPE